MVLSKDKMKIIFLQKNEINPLTNAIYGSISLLDEEVEEFAVLVAGCYASVTCSVYHVYQRSCNKRWAPPS